MAQIYDISPIISEQLGVFPGDMAFSKKPALHFEHGHNLVLHSIQTTVHLGAHTDAPLHYHPQGQSIEKRSLEYYLGPCQVIEVKLPRGERILPEHLKHKTILQKRILFKTGSFPNPNRWNSDFCSLSPELVHQLAKEGVILIGIDTPSVDPEKCQALESHQAIHEHNMANLEGIVLDQVTEGTYQLIALPLPLQGLDASPVRAILVKD